MVVSSSSPSSSGGFFVLHSFAFDSLTMTGIISKTKQFYEFSYSRFFKPLGGRSKVHSM